MAVKDQARAAGEVAECRMQEEEQVMNSERIDSVAEDAADTDGKTEEERLQARHTQHGWLSRTLARANEQAQAGHTLRTALRPHTSVSAAAVARHMAVTAALHIHCCCRLSRRTDLLQHKSRDSRAARTKVAHTAALLEAEASSAAAMSTGTNT